jgi:hypothetical protein
MRADEVFIVGGRSLIYYESKGPKIDVWVTPCFTVPHFEENFSDGFISIFYLNRLATVL